jgi:hypothetical protein
MVLLFLTIVMGVPFLIRSMELILMYKFCRKFDEDEQVYIGGMTICEAMTQCFMKMSCKKSEKTDT